VYWGCGSAWDILALRFHVVQRKLGKMLRISRRALDTCEGNRTRKLSGKIYLWNEDSWRSGHGAFVGEER
jgi:hypothetical protein